MVNLTSKKSKLTFNLRHKEYILDTTRELIILHVKIIVPQIILSHEYGTDLLFRKGKFCEIIILTRKNINSLLNIVIFFDYRSCEIESHIP